MSEVTMNPSITIPSVNYYLSQPAIISLVVGLMVSAAFGMFLYAYCAHKGSNQNRRYGSLNYKDINENSSLTMTMETVDIESNIALKQQGYKERHYCGVPDELRLADVFVELHVLKEEIRRLKLSK